MRFIPILAACLITSALQAQSTGGTMVPSPPVSIPELKQYLNLTDGQVTSLQNIQKQKMQAQVQVSDQLQQKYATLQTLLLSSNPNPNTVGQTMIDIHNLEKQFTPSTEPYHTQALAVLTTPQTALLANLNTALQLQTTASQAVTVSLLIPPASTIGLPDPVVVSGLATASFPAKE